MQVKLAGHALVMDGEAGAEDRGEKAAGYDHRHDELHEADAEIAETGIDRQRVTLLRLREEEADIAH